VEADFVCSHIFHTEINYFGVVTDAGMLHLPVAI